MPTEDASLPDAVFSRASSLAEWIEKRLGGLEQSLDLAVYRFNSRELYHVLNKTANRGVKVRLLIDRNKFEESSASRELMVRPPFAVRLAYGRIGPGSKMHHKFAVLDGKSVITGSYNWTAESEEQNFENLVLLTGERQIGPYREEFEALWATARAFEA
jgi:phosphatidylserine/phosphatidylglycerophosphate/cardiolipin synthase-like enzyme